MPYTVALVPMKGHSERVPNKNLKEFNGRPLCHWILNTLDMTSEVNEIVVNTDSDAIASEATKFDATVLERPQRLRGGDVSMNKIILHDVDKVDADTYIQTHCTNPLLQSETVSDALTTFEQSSRHDSLFSVTPLQTRLWSDDGHPINHRRGELKRTQDLTPVYEENSNLYIFTEDSIREQHNRIGSDPYMYPIEEPESIDIDVPVDFQVAEFHHRHRYGSNPQLSETADR